MDKDGLFLSSLLRASSKAYAAGAVERQAALQPEDVERYAPRGFATLVQETEMRLLHLAEAVAAGRPALFEAHLAWVKIAATSRDVPPEFLETNLVCLQDELHGRLPAGQTAPVESALSAGREVLERLPNAAPTLLGDDSPRVDLARRYLLAVLEGHRDEAVGLVLDAADAGTPIPELYDVLSRVQGEMGRLWQMNELHSAEEHLGSRIAEELVILLRSRAPRAPKFERRVLITCVAGNHHELGARMVADYFAMAGWEALLLGADTPSPDVARGIHDFEPDLLAVSANLILHVSRTAELIQGLRADARCADIPVMVGGGPFNLVPDLWTVVGADGHAPSAPDAVAMGAELVARGR